MEQICQSSYNSISKFNTDIKRIRDSRFKSKKHLKYTLVLQVMGSESTIAGHLPPNSKVTGVKCLAAAVITMRPTWLLPAGVENAN